QARQSARFREIVDGGFNPIYQEKAQAGLSIYDRHQQVIYSSRYPQYQYPRFENIPDLLVGALLFIENRELLDDDRERSNPAVDWGRLARAAAGQGLRKLHLGGGRAGGSTLATQMEKFRYSPGGRTQDTDDKLRQMISASLRAYRDGPDTLDVRRQIVLDYLNSVPLGGVPRYGEVNGIGDGLWAWFGADFATVNRLLSDSEAPVEARARAFKQGLMLLVAQRRPSGMLSDRDGSAGLEKLTDSYLRLLHDDGLISQAMLQAALRFKLAPTGAPPAERVASFVDRKAVNEIRGTLGELLAVPDLYELDRFDLEVESSFDGAAQNAVTALLGRLSSPEFIRCAGLRAERMLARGDPREVNYSVTLYESTPLGNRLRVQADNLNQPLDINAGTKLDLGSSAKLRTLVSYLNVIADLHRRYAGLDLDALKALPRPADDRLSSWALNYLIAAPDKTLQTMLEAAMTRTYPADPRELFYTGGGIHKFSNFKREDDLRNPSVAEALEQSINLSFVRIMGDVAHYHAYEADDAPGRALRQGDPAARRALLDRFAEREGLGYLRTYWHKYRDVAPAERLALLVDGAPLKRSTQAAAFLSVLPDADFASFADFMAERLGPAAGSEAVLRKLYEQHRSRRYNLSDQGYLARVHPLELWLVRHLMAKPEATLREIVTASVDARREAQRWILAPRYRDAQDMRIKTVVEVAAFERIAEEWRRLGYPFEQLV
ncbi:MAG TPA: transglycosylase domain-containing protein, partial [Rhodocyclaceae bacterium]|nr:transglycosylase domain-containing protein [Rhodocyclaceae bacterium]